MRKELKNTIQSSIAVKTAILENEKILEACQEVIETIYTALKGGRSVFFCGNGGSAADALHLAAEFSGRFYLDRKALPVEALNVNMAAVTAISNDFGFDQLYARMLESKARKGDVLCLLTTSGKSLNIINAALKANEIGVLSFAFTGMNLTSLDTLVKLAIKIPSTDTPRIQECHLLLGHIICEQVEKYLFNE